MPEFFTPTNSLMRVKHRLFQFILFFVCSSLFVDGWVLIYPFITNLTPIDFHLTGRWFDMIISRGQFFTPSIVKEPAAENELYVGLVGVHIVGSIFTTTIVLIYSILKLSPSFSYNFIIGLGLVVLPLFIELPLMGAGIMGLNSISPSPPLIMLRTFLIHAAYGVGLGVGAALSNYLQKNSRYTKLS